MATSQLTIQRLESYLWEAANILRGSPVDRKDWKSYILPLLFFKRICDVWDEEYQEALDTYGEDFYDKHRFQIPEDCHWNDVRETPTNVGTALQNAMRGIEAANQKHQYGVFGDAQWTNKERLPDALLKDLVETVIGLAPNLFYDTGLAACILILKNHKIPERKDKVLIVDTSELYRKGRAQNFLEPEHATEILSWVQDFDDVKNRARVVSLNEIKEEDWTLNISRYVLPPIGEDIPPLDAAIADIKAALQSAKFFQKKHYMTL